MKNLSPALVPRFDVSEKDVLKLPRSFSCNKLTLYEPGNELGKRYLHFIKYSRIQKFIYTVYTRIWTEY